MKMFRACALLTCYYIIGGQVENHFIDCYVSTAEGDAYFMWLIVMKGLPVVVDTLKPLDEIVKDILGWL